MPDEPRTARRADALVAIARSSLADTASSADGDPCEINVHIDVNSLAGAHHIHHWARGGPTALDNLIQLCSYHHRLVHEGGFCVERVGKRGVRFRRPDGCLIPETSPPRRAGGPGLERQHRAQGVAISAETCKPRSLGDPLDYGIAVEGLCASTERAQAPTHAREGPHVFPEGTA
jgi:hypothetical protein